MDLGATADALAPTDSVSGPGTWCSLPTTAASRVSGALLPAGFCIRRYARVREARVLQFSPTGDLFVSSPQQTTPGFTGPGDGAIYVLPDDNHDGVADANLTYLDLHTRREFETVHGLMFQNGLLYYTYAGGVNAIPYASGDRAPHTPAAGINAAIVPVADLSDADRWTHDLATDGAHIFVTMGVYGADRCPLANPRQGAILAIGPGHAMQGDIWAQGFRDPLFIRCQSWGSCYVSELTDDGWFGLGREKIATFHSGDNFGYPCCYDTSSPSSLPQTTPFNCATVATSMAEMPLGYTPMGQDFERGQWPQPYANGLFIGLHGAVGSWSNTGIQWIPMDPSTHQPTGPATVFLGGWGAPPAANVGRVVDALFAPDGRLFFTDDQAGAVFWIAPTTLQIPTH